MVPHRSTIGKCKRRGWRIVVKFMAGNLGGGGKFDNIMDDDEVMKFVCVCCYDLF